MCSAPPYYEKACVRDQGIGKERKMASGIIVDANLPENGTQHAQRAPTRRRLAGGLR